MVRRLNIDGDGQGDLSGHGGEQRAVLVYQIESYRHWEKHFGRDDLEYGQFGENLTVEGMPDDEVCIGDRYRIGEAEFEVTQPRVTCYRVGLRFGEPQLPALLVSHHRPGFYMRVVTEGRVQAGDEIVKTMAGPGALSVADTDALLYLPGHDPAALRRALRIPALSPGWQGSFREMLATADAAADGRRPDAGPAWPGFRALRVTAVVPETASVSSIQLAAPDASALPPARAGQYITVRITGDGEPAIVRSYSLSSPPGASAYRISVKREPHGAASGYLHDTLSPGDTLEVAAPRGEFILDPAESGPVLLISAGIGATPVLAMLHQLAAAHAHRQVWWIHAARGPREHPFAAEARSLLASLPDARECLFYSAATDTEARDGGAARGRLTPDALARLGLPGDATAYLCGPAGFMADVRQALVAAGLDAARIRTEAFGALDASTPWPRRAEPPPAAPAGQAGHRARRRPAGDVRAQRHLHALFHPGRGQPAGASRRLRRPRQVGLPHGRLPHLRYPAAVREHQLLPGPAGAAGRRTGAHLLRPARHRRRAGHVTAASGPAPLTPPAACAPGPGRGASRRGWRRHRRRTAAESLGTLAPSPCWGGAHSRPRGGPSRCPARRRSRTSRSRAGSPASALW